VVLCTRYKYYERWATANDFPVENIINDGTTGYETRLGAVANFQLCVRNKKIEDDVMVVCSICTCCFTLCKIGKCFMQYLIEYCITCFLWLGYYFNN
jgi:hypothetical protein